MIRGPASAVIFNAGFATMLLYKEPSAGKASDVAGHSLRM
jgi:hypothetical protein